MRRQERLDVEVDLMGRKMMLAGCLALLLLLTAFVMPGPVAHSQGGEGDKVVLGQSYTLGTGERLGGNLTVLGGNVKLEKGSLVDGNVVELGGNLGAAGEIRGNLSVFGGSVDLASNAVVQGDLATFGGALHRAPGAQVHGRTVESFKAPQLGDTLPALPFVPPALPLVPQLPAAPEVPATPATPAAPSGPGLFGRFVIWQLATVGWAVLLALLGIGAILLAPRHIERIASAVAAEPVFSVAVGLLTLIVAALAGTLLLLACGLGLLVWFATFLGLLVGWLAVGLLLGQRLLRALRLHTASSLPEEALGVFLTTVVARLPCIGFLFALVAGSLGLGAVVLTRFGTRSFARMNTPAGYLGRGASAADDRPLP
jgi:hypothetical protein